ncbi:SIS domain-containing protein [Nakamurella endophytica]|uniref:SIS domain-containing protein n=1 Tax=Nakamurella endophytica TaxID=1748367 RepID=A0A917TA99_9ACTN|nr:SIS domain-containing protein [Nakamurella endophytica]GGM14917.1 hypothetical protein GCM10011594_38650 [Nakamurella endophytica]
MTDSPLQQAARAVLDADAKAVAAIADKVGPEFDACVRLILGCTGRVVTSGSGTSGAVARRMAHLLSVCGTPAFYLHPADALHGSLGALVAGDVLIALSKGGGSREVNDLVDRALARGASVVAVTATPQSHFAQAAHVVVDVDVPAGADPGEVVAMGSTVAVSAWSDALALVLMRARGYRWSDVLFTHPSGAVGQIATPPADLEPLPVPAAEPAP